MQVSKRRFIFYVVSISVLILTIISACKPNQDDKSINKRKQALIVHHLKDEASFDKQSIEIDSFVLALGKVTSSLDYSKENGAFIHVDAHMDDNENILLIEEEFQEPFDGEIGLRKYYLQKGKIFKTREVLHNSKNAQTFIERISYYAPNGQCLKTKERTGSSELILDKIPFNAIPKFVCNVDRAMRALNKEKEFRITFQGFVTGKDGEYMVVGEPGKDTYTSALKVDPNDKFIKELKEDEYRFVNGTIYLHHEKIRETNGLTYQRLLKASWEKFWFRLLSYLPRGRTKEGDNFLNKSPPLIPPQGGKFIQSPSILYQLW